MDLSKRSPQSRGHCDFRDMISSTGKETPEASRVGKTLKKLANIVLRETEKAGSGSQLQGSRNRGRTQEENIRFQRNVPDVIRRDPNHYPAAAAMRGPPTGQDPLSRVGGDTRGLQKWWGLSFSLPIKFPIKFVPSSLRLPPFLHSTLSLHSILFLFSLSFLDSFSL